MTKEKVLPPEPPSPKESSAEVIKRDIQRKCKEASDNNNNNNAASTGDQNHQQPPWRCQQIIEDELSDGESAVDPMDSIEPMPTETPLTVRGQRQTSSSTPGAFHTNATNTRMRAAGKTPRCVLGAELRLANKPGGQDFAAIRRQQQQQQQEPSSPAEQQQSTRDEAAVGEDLLSHEEVLNNLIEASPVVEEFLKDLQQAEEIDPELASRKSWKSAASSRHSSAAVSAAMDEEDNNNNNNNNNKPTPSVAYCMAALLTFLVSGITLVLVFTLTDEDVSKEKELPSLSAPTQFPTLPPTSLDSYVLNLLPSSTIQTIQKDPNSPQARAYEWLMLDPHINETNYHSEERVLQRFVLSTLFYSTDGFNWRNSSQWLSYYTHECQWYTRSTFAMKETIQYIYDGYLTEVSDDNLEKCNQEGIINHLWLDSNDLVGTIPDELYLLTSLQSLSMGLNPGLGGKISTQIGHLTNLQGLALYYNRHGGKIPSQVGLLTDLKSLGINDNGHTGTLPREIYDNLTNLQTITLARNYLTGTIPTSIANLSQLRWFVTDETNLEGSLSSEMGQLSLLEWLVVGGNRLTGSLPTQLGLLSSNLLLLSLFENQFTGTLPTQLGRLEKTTLLSFRANQFGGTIPYEYGSMTDLTLALNFQDNPQLTGTIPSELGGLTNLLELAFVNNGHTGRIPSELGRLTKLRRLTLGNNSLSGSVPTELSSIASTLYTLNLQGNPMLSGTVPEALCHINATCIAGSLNPCEGRLGLEMDCTEILCGCGKCACHNKEEEEAPANAHNVNTTTVTTLVVIPPQD